MTQLISKLPRRLAPLAAVALLVAAMGGTWTRSAVAAPPPAATLTKPAGRVVYVTCSVLAEENGDQVRGFLARHPQFMVVPPTDVAGALGERAFMFRRATLMSEEGLLMTPRRTETDGFYVSMLIRHG